MPTPMLPTREVPPHMRPIAIDTETFLIMPGRQAPPLVCVSTCEPGEAPQLYDHIDGLQVFRDLLLDDTRLLVFCNAPFDLAVFCNEDPKLLPLVFAAFLKERIVDISTWQRLYLIKQGWSKYDPIINMKVSDKTFSLEFITKRWLNEHITGKTGEDVWRKRYHELYCVPLEQWPREAVDYAAGDAWYTIRCWQSQHQQEGILPDFWRKMRQNWALYLKTCRGLKTCEPTTRELETSIHEHVDEALLDLLDEGLYYIKKEKGKYRLSQRQKEVRRRVEESFARLGIPVPKTDPSDTYPQGQTKIDDETLEKTDDEALNKIADVGYDNKLKSTYLPVLLAGSKYCVNPRYRLPVDTGRSSSSAPNVQNVPRKGGVRECYVPRVGYVFVDCDYNIAELRSLAQVLINMYGISQMAQVIQEGEGKKGRDIHCMMAAAIMGISFDEFAERFNRGDKECKAARQLAKSIDFGAPGGLGPDTFIEYVWTASEHKVKISRERAEELLQLYRQTFPEMEQYFADIGALCGRGGTTTLIQHGSGRVRGGAKFCPACNSNFQGLTADGALEAVWRVTVECYLGIRYFDDQQVLDAINILALAGESTPLYGCYPVWFIHDEIGLEAPFAQAQAAAARLSEVMCEAMEIFTPDVKSTAEADIRRRWYKEAEPHYRCPSCSKESGSATCKTCNTSTELIPWSPPNPRHLFVAKLEKKADELKERFIEVDESLYWGEAPWTEDELAAVNDILPPAEDDPDYWKKLNNSWRWELRARTNNPDPWC